MQPQRFRELVPDRLDRVQRAEGVLEDHRNPPAAHGAEHLLVRVGQLELAELDRARDDPTRRLE